MNCVLTVILLVSVSSLGMALQCYTCSIGEQDVDTSCVDNPESLGSLAKTNCNKKYCTIIRQEYVDPQGRVASFSRGCEDKPLFMNQIIEDATYRIYYTACQDTLCNSGSGKASDGGGSSTVLGDKSTIIVKGIGNGASFTSLSIIVTISSIVLFCLL